MKSLNSQSFDMVLQIISMVGLKIPYVTLKKCYSLLKSLKIDFLMKEYMERDLDIRLVLRFYLKNTFNIHVHVSLG